jgi:hypothetical protein
MLHVLKVASSVATHGLTKAKQHLCQNGNERLYAVHVLLSSPTSSLTQFFFSSFHAVELFMSRYLTYPIEIQRSIDYGLLGESECHYSQKMFF